MSATRRMASVPAKKTAKPKPARAGKGAAQATKARKPSAKAGAGAPPKTEQDAVFGVLTWDPGLDWWVGEVELAGAATEVSVSPDEAPLAKVLPIARETFAAIVEREPDLRKRAAKELLPVFNASWSEGKTIEADDFAARMKPTSICIYADGSADLFYDDGDLFWGHSIVVAVKKGARFVDADIAG